MTHARRSTTVLFVILALATPALAGELTGAITGYANKVVTLRVAEGTGPEKGTGATLSKHFETKLGSLKTSGWLQIATVTVEGTGASLRLKVVEEKSKMKVNGKPVNHFKPGTKVKLVWE
jgi:hypothetical protein